jgi:hypothetical protein
MQPAARDLPVTVNVSNNTAWFISLNGEQVANASIDFPDSPTTKD